MFCCFNKLTPRSSPSVKYESICLKDITWDETIPFVPEISTGSVIKVYDGDTITIATKMYDLLPLYRFSVRLNGIDTPEIRTHNENEKKHAIIAKNALSEKILGKMITLKNISLEKYGRILADIYYENEHLNSWMIDQGYAVKYDGKTKEKPEKWFE